MVEPAARSVEPIEEIEGPTPPASTHPTYHQEHTVVQGSHVTLHGGVFAVKDNVYRWEMRDPKGEAVTLANPSSAEPSFIATELGDYRTRLATLDGYAEFIFHVI